ncbi:MAG: DNA-processing protein DprA [Cyanobacteria bacterium]|nr:DNA-processing protein DprA [Cyanobacteriota bacterium]
MEERSYWLAWRELNGIGAVLLHRLWQHFGSVETAWTATSEDLQQVEGIGKQRSEKIVADRQPLNPEKLLATYQQYNPHFIVPSDAEYPAMLKSIPDAPTILHYRGDLELLKSLETRRGIAIVGTRKAGKYGSTWAERYSQVLTQQDFIIISGLAEGIDAIAHEACIGAGGQTIAVLGNGVDQVYPHSNRDLYERIEHNGLILSEYPAGTRPDRKHFPARNRIVAGLSHATLVMEAGLTSGALITANLANEYGREVYALAGNLDSPQSEGCIHLILQGAHILPKPEKFLELLEVMPSLCYEEPKSKDLEVKVCAVLQTLEPSLQILIDSIIQLHNNAPIDLIIETTKMSTSEVSSGLLQLEMMDLIVQNPGMRYAIV